MDAPCARLPRPASTTRYDSAASLPSFGRELKELFQYRDLLLLLITNSVKTRYKRSAFGVLWTMLNPLLHMAVMAIAFTAVFRSSLEHYPVYLLSGLICWNFFTQTTVHAMHRLVWGGGLVRRVYFPRSVFALATIGNGLVNLGLSLLPLVVIMLILGHPLHASWWFVPIAIFLLTIFSLGTALLMSTLAVFFADIVDIYEALLHIMFFLTPIMYPKSIVPARYAWCHQLNPMHHLIEVFREPIYSGVLPDAATLGAAALVALAGLWLGWRTFMGKIDELAYHV